MKKGKVFAALVGLAALLLTSCQGGTASETVTELRIWTQEGESDGAFQYVEALGAEFTAATGIKVTVENKETETLREDFQTASLAGGAPEIVWTVNDHVGPFKSADIIQPLDTVIDLSKYVDASLLAVTVDGKKWGVPVSYGNHLMLLYNKDLIATAPENSDEMITVAKSLTSGGRYGLVFNQTEPFWLVPFLGGFGGKVFAADGVTPSLDTPEMVATLKFLRDLKYVHNVIPPESDYGTSDTLFKEGKAAMLINGDWSLGEYQGVFGDKLGVARIPKISSTGLWPAPYTAGKFIMVSKAVTGEKLKKVAEFIDFATNKKNQLTLVDQLVRLPALKEVLEMEVLIDDELINNILKSSADQMVVGTPMPANLEMRYNWDAMRPQMAAVMADKETPENAAKLMQQIALQQAATASK